MELSRQMHNANIHTRSDSMPCVAKAALLGTPFIGRACRAKHSRWGDSDGAHRHIPQQQKHQRSPCWLSFLCTERLRDEGEELMLLVQTPGRFGKLSKADMNHLHAGNKPLLSVCRDPLLKLPFLFPFLHKLPLTSPEFTEEVHVPTTGNMTHQGVSSVKSHKSSRCS